MTLAIDFVGIHKTIPLTGVVDVNIVGNDVWSGGH